MDITFYTDFEKRENSTRRPTGTGTTLQGKIKDPCSMLSPVITFQSVGITAAPNTVAPLYTYAYIPAFHRYYFVSDWRFENALWTVYLKIDVLATYRTDIYNSSAYIERRAATSVTGEDYFDGNVIDTAYPTKTNPIILNTALSTPWGEWDAEDGVFVVGVIRPQTSASIGGAVTYYALSDTEIYHLFAYLLGNSFYTDNGFASPVTATQQLAQETAKALVNPLQYIVSCMWFPIYMQDLADANMLSQNAEQIITGPWTTTATGKRLINWLSYRQTATVTLPTHPQSSTRGDFLKYAPFTEHVFYCPPCGSFSVDPSSVKNGTVTLTLSVDLPTGVCALDLQTSAPEPGSAVLRDVLIHHADGMIGVPIPLAQITTDRLTQGLSIVGAIGHGAMGVVGMATASPGAVVGGITGMLSSIGDAIRASFPTVQTSGTPGCFINSSRLGGTFTGITSKFYLLVDEDNAEMGRPLCKVKQLGLSPGFVKCGEVTVDYTAFDEEKRMIHSYLLSGFFME